MTRTAAPAVRAGTGWSPARVRALVGVLVVLQLARSVTRGPTPFARSYYSVDYRAGFVRRGLAGQVLHLLAGPGQTAVTWAAVVVALVPTLAVLALLEALVRRRTAAAAATAVLLAASPFVLDQLWLHRRPDQLGLAVLVATGFATARGRARPVVLAACGVGWAVVALVHEGAVLYSGTAAVGLVVVAAPDAAARWRGALLVGGPGLVAVVAATVLGAATPAQAAALQATARPETRGDSVLFYLGDGVGDSLRRVVGFDHGAQAAVLVVGAVLVAVHLGWLRATGVADVLAEARRRLPRGWLAVVVVVPGSALLLTFATGTDWARWVCAFGAAWLVSSASRVLARPDPQPGAPVGLPVGLVVLALYLAALSPLREQLTVHEALTLWLPAL
ncbi:hypothetical protein GCM10027047_03630 [Rhodococcus aerolatus]